MHPPVDTRDTSAAQSCSSSPSVKRVGAEDRFEKVTNEVQDYAIILLDRNGTILSWNKGAERIKGYAPAEIVGQSFKLFYSKEDKERKLPDTLLAKTLSEGRIAHEGWRIKKDGTRFWAHVTLTALHDDNGEVINVLKLTRDLTDRKVSEDLIYNYIEELKLKKEQLERSEERYHKMISEVKDYAIILLDKDGTVLDWNEGARRLKGYDAPEIVGKSFTFFYPYEDKLSGLPHTLLAKAVSDGAVTHEGWRVRKDGSRFWANVTITSLHSSDGEVIGFSKVTKDLTEKKALDDQVNNFTEKLLKANQELRRSEERYHKMIAEVKDYAIILLDRDGKIQNWNAGATLLKGYTSEEIIGKSFTHFYTPEDLERGLPEILLKKAAQEGRVIDEGWRQRKDGMRFWASVVITALHEENGGIMGFSKVTRDLTERKATEDSLRATAREMENKNKKLEVLNEALSSFAYVVSHDLKEPLRKIRIFSAFQRDPSKSPDDIKQLSLKIEESAERMQSLMEGLLNYAELSNETPFERVNLNEVVDGVLNDLELVVKEKEAQIEVASLPTFQGVRYQLHQLFLNLISNALKFSREGVRPMIIVDCKESQEVAIENNSLESKNYWKITVSDNGRGFPQEHAKKIFEVFYRLHAKNEFGGSGIGLAVVKKVMLNHFGHVEASSEPDKGSAFSLYFPREQHATLHLEARS